MLTAKTIQRHKDPSPIKMTVTAHNLKLVTGSKKLSAEITAKISTAEILAILKFREEFTPDNDAEIACLVRFPG